jgi:hypothetical protein
VSRAVKISRFKEGFFMSSSRKYNAPTGSDAEKQAQTYIEKRNALQKTQQRTLTEEEEAAQAQVLEWLERKRKNWQRKK